MKVIAAHKDTEKLSGTNPDHHKLDLFNAIERGELPS